MKVRNGFVLRSVADTYAVIPLGEAAEKLNGFITLNDSGAMLWKLLEKGANEAALEQSLLDRYDVSNGQARADVKQFLDKLRGASALDE